jgi:hypothetical protein
MLSPEWISAIATVAGVIVAVVALCLNHWWGRG